MSAVDKLVKMASDASYTPAEVQLSLERARVVVGVLNALKEASRTGEAEGIMLGVAVGALHQDGASDEFVHEKVQEMLDSVRELQS